MVYMYIRDTFSSMLIMALFDPEKTQNRLNQGFSHILKKNSVTLKLDLQVD